MVAAGVVEGACSKAHNEIYAVLAGRSLPRAQMACGPAVLGATDEIVLKVHGRGGHAANAAHGESVVATAQIISAADPSPAATRTRWIRSSLPSSGNHQTLYSM